MENFHDIAALDRFAEAVRREVDDPQSPIDAKSPEAGSMPQSRLCSPACRRPIPAASSPTRSTISSSPISSASPSGDDMRRLFPPRRRGHLSRHRHGAAPTTARSSATSMTARPPRGPASWSAMRSLASTARPITRSHLSAARSGGRVEIKLRRQRRGRSRSGVEGAGRAAEAAADVRKGDRGAAPRWSNATAARSATSGCGRSRRRAR